MARLLFLAASVALAVTVFSSFPAGKVAVASSPTGPKTWSHVGGNPQNTGQVGGQVASNGHQQWSFNTNNVVTAGVAISANRIFVGSQEGVMYVMTATFHRVLLSCYYCTETKNGVADSAQVRAGAAACQRVGGIQGWVGWRQALGGVAY